MGQKDRPDLARVTGTGQLFAHFSARALGMQTMHGVTVTSGPTMHFATDNKYALGDQPCIQAAAFQNAVGDVMVDRAGNGIEMAKSFHPNLSHLVIAGGVAANTHLRQRLTTLCQERGLNLVAPPPGLCTDNGAMIAWAGVERLGAGLYDPLDVEARARWPLDPNAKPAPFAGKKA